MIPTSDQSFRWRVSTGSKPLWRNALARARHCKKIATNLVAGKLRVEESGDNEERDEIEKLYRIIDQYNLYGKIRWLGVRLTKTESGEIYRVVPIIRATSFV